MRPQHDCLEKAVRLLGLQREQIHGPREPLRKSPRRGWALTFKGCPCDRMLPGKQHLHTFTWRNRARTHTSSSPSPCMPTHALFFFFLSPSSLCIFACTPVLELASVLALFLHVNMYHHYNTDICKPAHNCSAHTQIYLYTGCTQTNSHPETQKQSHK